MAGHTCEGTVRSGSVGRRWLVRSVTCGKTAKVERDGKWYCGTHDPVAVAVKHDKRNAERDAKWVARTAKFRLEQAAPELLEALKAARLWVALYHAQIAADPVTHPDAIANIVADREAIDAAIAEAEGR